MVVVLVVVMVVLETADGGVNVSSCGSAGRGGGISNGSGGDSGLKCYSW